MDILHLAAPCRNVPVTFTLDLIGEPVVRFVPHVLAVLTAGAAPALYFGAAGLVAGSGVEELGSFLFVWGVRDALLASILVLPVLALLRRLGLRRAPCLWGVAALVGIPMGYVIANPATFAWTPSEEDFEHGMYWGRLIAYAALFGLSGAVYGIGKSRNERHAG